MGDNIAINDLDTGHEKVATKEIDKINYYKTIPVDLNGESLTPFRTDMEGGKVSVGTTAVEVTFTGTTKYIILSADFLNIGTLYVGKSNVTNLGANALAFLRPGEWIELSYDDINNPVYVVSDTAAQNFFKGALL